MSNSLQNQYTSSPPSTGFETESPPAYPGTIYDSNYPAVLTSNFSSPPAFPSGASPEFNDTTLEALARMKTVKINDEGKVTERGDTCTTYRLIGRFTGNVGLILPGLQSKKEGLEVLTFKFDANDKEVDVLQVFHFDQWLGYIKIISRNSSCTYNSAEMTEIWNKYEQKIAVITPRGGKTGTQFDVCDLGNQKLAMIKDGKGDDGDKCYIEFMKPLDVETKALILGSKVLLEASYGTSYGKCCAVFSVIGVIAFIVLVLFKWVIRLS